MIPNNIKSAVLDCLSRHYGIRGELRRLGGENLNILVTTGNGERFVAKIVGDDMPPAVVEMKFQAIEYAIKAGFEPGLPKMVLNNSGKLETGIKLRTKLLNRLIMSNYIDGTILQCLPDISTILLKNIGFTLAGFNLAMQGFDHPAAHRSHRWNLAEAGRHKDKIALVKDESARDQLSWAFDAWASVAPRLAGLPWQFIHGDANRENIMVRDGRVCGLVDFGDCCFNPTVCDLAICLAYLMMDRKDPLATASLVADAYHSVRPLEPAERELLFPLVCGRLAASIAVSTRRRQEDPDNPNWFTSEAPAWDLLRVLRESGARSI